MAEEKVATAYPKDFTSCLIEFAHKLIVVDNRDQRLFWHIVLLLSRRIDPVCCSS